MTYPFPVDQIGRMPDQQSWIIIERRMSHIIIFAHSKDRRIGVISAQHWITVKILFYGIIYLRIGTKTSGNKKDQE
jgi:hypothetical protein